MIIYKILRKEGAKEVTEKGFEKWAIRNCSDINALNKALLSGSKTRYLKMYTAKIKETARKKILTPYGRCKNCIITTRGISTYSDGSNWLKRLYYRWKKLRGVE